MNKKIRIATWNVDRPKIKGWVKNRILKQIVAIDADIWILTETSRAIDLSPMGYVGHASERLPARPDENKTTVWSKYPVKQVIPTDISARTAVCVDIEETPVGPLLVYGTIITWHGDKGVDGNSRQWEEHYRSIEAHSSDWDRIQQRYPGRPLCVAGDFNQSRDGSNWYGTKEGRALLTTALDQNNLVCLTEEDMVATGKLRRRHNIDHICVSEGLAEKVKVDAWEGRNAQGKRMSDHNGVFVDIYEP